VRHVPPNSPISLRLTIQLVRLPHARLRRRGREVRQHAHTHPHTHLHLETDSPGHTMPTSATLVRWAAAPSISTLLRFWVVCPPHRLLSRWCAPSPCAGGWRRRRSTRRRAAPTTLSPVPLLPSNSSRVDMPPPRRQPTAWQPSERRPFPRARRHSALARADGRLLHRRPRELDDGRANRDRQRPRNRATPLRAVTRHDPLGR